MIEEFLRVLSDPAVLIPLSSILGATATAYVTTNTIKNYKIIKDNKDKKISFLPSHIVDECKEVNTSRFSGDIKDTIEEFYSKLSNKVDDKLLINFRNNLESLKINKGKTNHFFIGGYYCASNNSIIYTKNKKHLLFHELLHMASSHREKNVLYTGFEQYTGGVSVGDGFNEGYTELLTNRFFNKNKFDNKGIIFMDIYNYLVRVMRVVEDVVGKDKMIEYYFKSDMPSLCNDLLKYINESDLRLLFANTDYLVECFKHLQGGITHNFNMDKFDSVNQILISMYTNKLKQNNELTKENLDRLYNMLPKTYISELTIFGGTYDINREIPEYENLKGR